MAESVALAVLENLVHLARQDFPIGYVCVAAVIPDSMNIATEQDLRLRADLREPSSLDLGDWWIDSKGSAVLDAPSVLVAGEHNYLLNPAHPDFARIVADPPALFQFDPRLFR
jgi:RES domain-containing protein